MTLFFVFMDSFERIKNGPWESMTSPTGVSFIGSQRSRAQPTAAGYLQQWGHYLLIGTDFHFFDFSNVFLDLERETAVSKRPLTSSESLPEV